MERFKIVVAATAGLMTLAGGAVVASSANATVEPEPGPVVLKSLNGSDPRNKAFVYEGQFQTFSGTSVPWTFLSDESEFGTPIMAQPAASVVVDGEEVDAIPVHFGGRQRIGVKSPGETDGGQFDSISPGETLTITRGPLLIDEGAVFDGLDVKLNGKNATAVITAFLGDTEVASDTVAITTNENGGGTNVQADGLFEGTTFDRLEFTSQEGRYGLKGFYVLELSVTKDAVTTLAVEDLLQGATITRPGDGTYTVQAVNCPDQVESKPGTIAFGDAEVIFDGFDPGGPIAPGTLGFSVVPDNTEDGCFYRISGAFERAGFILFDVDDNGEAPLKVQPGCVGKDMIPDGEKACFNTFSLDTADQLTVFELYGDFDARGRLFN